MMLIVYKAKRALCQQVALTMPPLDEKSERSTQEPSVTH